MYPHTAEPMKVQIFNPSISRKAGGLFLATRKTATALSQRNGVEIQVLAPSDEYAKEDGSEWTVNFDTCDVWGPSSFGFAPAMHRKVSEFDPDIIHHCGLWKYSSAVGLRQTRGSGTPMVISPVGMLDRWALDNARWKKRIAAWLYEDEHLQAATCIHALCTSELKSIRDYGLTNPVCVIPNGVEIRAHSSASDVPWEGLFSSNRHVLLFLGRLHPKKGLPNLIVAWENWKNMSPSSRKWGLAIAGWSQVGHKEELEEQVAARELQEDIKFLGPLYGADKQAAFTNADAFILPSHSEGLPMAVLEAWSYHLPVLMTPQCNIPAGFEAEAAVRIDPEPASIAEGLRQLAAMDPDELMAMGQRGRALVERRFTWARVAEQMHHVYRWMLGEADRPDCVVTDTNHFALS